MSDRKIYVVLFDGTGNTYGDCKTNDKQRTEQILELVKKQNEF